MKRILAILLALVALAGCGAAASPPSYSSAPMAAADAGFQNAAPITEGMYDNVVTGGGEYESAAKMQQISLNAAPGSFQRKVIKDAGISMESKEFDTTVQQIADMVKSLNGYMESSNTLGSSYDYNYDYDYEYSPKGVRARRADFTARIPSEKLEEALALLNEMGNVTRKTESAQDISDQYYDLEARLESLRIQEERYLELLRKADKMEDIITLESALTEVRYNIESLTGMRNRYDQLVAYSTLQISLLEVGDFSVVRNQPLGFGQRISNAFSDSLRFIGDTAQWLVVVLVSVLPVLLVYSLLIGVIAWAIYRIVKALRKRFPPKPYVPMQAQQNSLAGGQTGLQPRQTPLPGTQTKPPKDEEK